MRSTDATLRVTCAAYGFEGHRFAHRGFGKTIAGAPEGATHIAVDRSPVNTTIKFVHIEDRTREFQVERDPERARRDEQLLGLDRREVAALWRGYDGS